MIGRNLSVKFADAILDWFIFPALLFIQFGATIYCQYQRGELTVCPKLVFIGVALFCLVAVAYRHVYRIHPIQSLVLLLLPEVFTNGILAAVMLSSLETSFSAMMSLTCLMGVMAGAGYVQISQYKNESEDAVDYLLLVQEEEEDSDDEWVC